LTSCASDRRRRPAVMREQFDVARMREGAVAAVARSWKLLLITWKNVRAFRRDRRAQISMRLLTRT